MNTDFHSPVDPGDLPSDLTSDQLREADALEAILSRASGREKPEGPQETEGQQGTESMESLAELVSRVRSVCAAAPAGSGAESGSDQLQAQRVARRVLARTTREDLGRRGDLGVILGFAADRLRDSAVLRVAAALLIVQLTLVPLVAWQVWKAPHSGIFYTGIEPSAAELARALEDLPADDVVNDLEPERAGDGLDRELGRMVLEESVAESNAILRAHRAELSTVAPTSAAGEALRAMTELAGGRGLKSKEAARAPLTLESGARIGADGQHDALVEILGAESQLCHLAAGGGWMGLPEALENLAERMGGGSVELKSLAGRTMRRAELLGVALPAGGESLIEQTTETWIRGSGAWLRALGDAARAAEPSDPYIQAWVAAIVQDS